jgi:hypothetical protein
MEAPPSKKSPQFNDIAGFDMSFDYGIASAVSTVRTYQAAEQYGSCMHLEDKDAF